MAQPQMRRAIESGVPDNQQYLHPLLKKNYGNWRYHDRPRPGVLHHVAHGGDEVWTVRAGTQRQMDVHTIRRLCDIADKHAEGHVRFTIRSNIEFMVSSYEKVGPLIKELEAKGNLEGAYAAYADAAKKTPVNAESVRRRDASRTALLRSLDREGTQAFQRQNLDLAITKWDRILEIDPNNQKAKLERERCLELKKKMADKFGGAASAAAPK